MSVEQPKPTIAEANRVILTDADRAALEGSQPAHYKSALNRASNENRFARMGRHVRKLVFSNQSQETTKTESASSAIHSLAKTVTRRAFLSRTTKKVGKWTIGLYVADAALHQGFPNNTLEGSPIFPVVDYLTTDTVINLDLEHNRTKIDNSIRKLNEITYVTARSMFQLLPLFVMWDLAVRPILRGTRRSDFDPSEFPKPFSIFGSVPSAENVPDDQPNPQTP